MTEVQGNAGTVAGFNFVGGVVGRAVSSYKMKDIYSNANATASFSPINSESYNEYDNNLSSSSYAGSVVGYAGKGEIYNVHVNNITSVMGSRAGFAYGGIGEGANVQYTFIEIQQNSSIKAYHYGGFVAGEICGTLAYVHVPSNHNIESTFAVIPKVPLAVGGITGKLNGGKISDVLIEQDFRATSVNGSNVINYVGGIAGIVSADVTISSIINCKVTSEITSSNVLGGGIGQVASALFADGITVQSSKLWVTGERANPKLGGIVGIIADEGGSLEMKNSYCTSELAITTSTSGVQSVADAGGLVGASSKAPKLSYCYTTSIITAEVYDSRQTASLQDFADYTDEDASANYATFANSVTNGYDNVYFLGEEGAPAISGNVADKTLYKNLKTKGVVSFNTKVKNTTIGLKVNNYGETISNYVSEFGRENLAFKEDGLYNLWGNNYQLKNEKFIAGMPYREIFGMTYRGDDNTYYLPTGPIQNKMVFKEDSNAEGVYYWEIKASELTDYYTQLGSAFEVKYIYTAENNAVYEYYDNVSGKGFKNDDKTFVYSESESGYYYNGVDKLDLNKLMVRVTFDSSRLTQTKVLADSKGNYYKYSLAIKSGSVCESLINIQTNVQYYYNGYDFETIGGEVLGEIPTVDVWKTGIDCLSTLSFEDELRWLNKF